MLACPIRIQLRRRPIGRNVKRSITMPANGLSDQGSAAKPTKAPTCTGLAPFAASQAGMAIMDMPIGTPCMK